MSLRTLLPDGASPSLIRRALQEIQRFLSLGPVWSLRTVDEEVTLKTTDVFIRADATDGAFTIFLPPLKSVAPGKIYVIKKIDAVASVTLDGDGDEEIDRATTKAISSQYDSVNLAADPANDEWMVW